MKRTLTALALVLATGPSFAVDGIIIGTPRVIDGDSMEIDGKKIRLHGIDAPELKQKCGTPDDPMHHCGTMAKESLELWISKSVGEITCTTVAVDKYQRAVAKCTLVSEQDSIIDLSHIQA